LLFVSINIINIIQGIIIINLPFYEIRCLSSLYFVYLIYKGDCSTQLNIIMILLYMSLNIYCLHFLKIEYNFSEQI